MRIMLKTHKSIILNASKYGFDAGGATFATLFYDEFSKKYFMFYTGALDVEWSEANIGLAMSKNGLDFEKVNEPVLRAESLSLREIVTPVVWESDGKFYMAFAGSPRGGGRKIMLAYSDDLMGPWTLLKVIAEPENLWEGNDIDLGPCIAKLGKNEFLLYYSNVSNKLKERLFKPKWWLNFTFWLRRVGILKLKIRSHSNIEVSKFEGNPLVNLNGPKGSWNESIFCPGYLKFGNYHLLFTSASTYSIGFPYKQYIGLASDSSPYFANPKDHQILINGPTEKKYIIPSIKSEIALDTPCPVIRGDELYLYYAVMDRADGIWKTALSIYTFQHEQ